MITLELGFLHNRRYAVADTEPGTPDLTARHGSRPEVHTHVVNALSNIIPKIKRRVRLAWAWYRRFKCELYDMEAAPFTLKVRMFKAEALETLLYGCATWTLGKEHLAVLLAAQFRFQVWVIGL